MVITWSDEEYDDENEDMTANVVKALTVKRNVEEDSSDERYLIKNGLKLISFYFSNGQNYVLCVKNKRS